MCVCPTGTRAELFVYLANPWVPWILRGATNRLSQAKQIWREVRKIELDTSITPDWGAHTETATEKATHHVYIQRQYHVWKQIEEHKQRQQYSDCKLWQANGWMPWIRYFPIHDAVKTKQLCAQDKQSHQIPLWATADSNTPQHNTIHYSIPQHTATRCNTLIHCSTLNHTATHWKESWPWNQGHSCQHMAARCNTLEHIALSAFYCNTLQHGEFRDTSRCLDWKSYDVFFGKNTQVTCTIARSLLLRHHSDNPITELGLCISIHTHSGQKSSVSSGVGDIYVKQNPTSFFQHTNHNHDLF